MIQYLLHILNYFTKLDKATTCLKYDVDVFVSSLQPGIDRRVIIHVFDINGKFKINGVPKYILQIQKVDGSTLYDALELSFNDIDKASMLKTSNVDILASINNKAVSNDVYNKAFIDLTCSSLFGAAPRYIKY